MENKGERFIVKKHNQHYWSIYHILEEDYLMIGCNYLLFENEEEAQVVCNHLNDTNCFC